MKIAVLGSGPAGMMAAHRAALQGAEVHLFEKRNSLGRKLLIAGSSGLNISHQADPHSFAEHYSGYPTDYWIRLFTKFSPTDWIHWIESELKLETFLGTSDRYFVREMKAANLVKHWQDLLQKQGVRFYRGFEFESWSVKNPEGEGGIELKFSSLKNDVLTNEPPTVFDRVGFFLGGGSWEESYPTWPSKFEKAGVRVLPFTPSNVGYEIAWRESFIREASGLPLKKIRLTSKRGSKLGELTVTDYGLEGTPIYFLGEPGEVTLDLKPDLSEVEIETKLLSVRENLSPLRRAKKRLALSEAAEALLFHETPEEIKKDLKSFIHHLKHFNLELLKPRPLKEAISSRGGVDLNEVDENLQLKKFPGIYCGGEMLNWDAPTGGFLIQACVSQGAAIGDAMVRGST